MVFPLDLVIWQFPLPLALWQKGPDLPLLEAVVLSFTNLTSAGQFAGLGIITAGSSLVEMAMAQLIINLRYCLMSCSLSQKLDSHMPFFHRFLMSYGVTDEIFGVSVCKSGVLSPYFQLRPDGYGCSRLDHRHPPWCCFRQSSSCEAVKRFKCSSLWYVPGSCHPSGKRNKVLRMVILVSMALSFLFTQIPVLRDISSGFKIIILTFIVAGSAAVLFPVKEEE